MTAWTDEEDAILKAMFDDFASDSTIGRMLKRSRLSVGGRRDRLGLRHTGETRPRRQIEGRRARDDKKPPKPIDAPKKSDRTDEYIALRMTGRTRDEIAADWGICAPHAADYESLYACEVTGEDLRIRRTPRHDEHIRRFVAEAFKAGLYGAEGIAA